MQVMGTINAAGFTKVALVAQLPKPSTAKKR
jgi:biopolymer transport protein ExbD